MDAAQAVEDERSRPAHYDDDGGTAADDHAAKPRRPVRHVVRRTRCIIVGRLDCGTSSGSASIQANQGRLAHDDAAHAYARVALTSLAPRSDASVLFSYRWEQPSRRTYLGVTLRGSGGWQNAYRPRSGYSVEMASDSATVSLVRNDDGTQTTLDRIGGAQRVTTDKQWLRLRVVGTTVQFRIWTDGQPEPTTWMATRSDGAVTAPGQLHFSLVGSGSNVGAKSALIDDLTVTDGS